ncbi:hypothetical protein LTR37_012394 [Vermiconidia calcicola]|uniref:Uncharacterized protein n=1 Tax=Vermiconidia calcicola TaxID=1690605 RepID=A0ACC3N112_9PEZI|nr:hypothetical protein LTR37_012394 [Vermiconidia calcicola]
MATEHLFLLLLLPLASLQQLHSQTNTWNSNFALTPDQIAAANLSATTANNVEFAVRYERTNNAGQLTRHDPFYDLPADFDPANPPPPGTVLKVEQYTNITHYTIPMSLSMSRFLYTTETLRGTSMPASAYVLWPYLPRTFATLTPYSTDRDDEDLLFPIVALAHGTSGQTQSCAPSNLRELWGNFQNSFPIALSGYAVVAPDYLGLGVAEMVSPYFVLPSHAHDLFHAIAAAQQTWPGLLSKEFAVMGQSQGGGVAWASAQRQAQRPVEGYLGTVAVSPFTDVLDIIAADDQAQNNGRVVAIAQGLASVLPSFEISEWITDAGLARLHLLQEIQGCGLTGAQLFSAEEGTVQILKDGWNLTESAKWYDSMSSNGGEKAIAGPMLVLQGMDDPNANEPVVTRSVRRTCEAFPEAKLEYLRFENITHVPVLYAGQHVWLDWIHDRFAGVEVPNGCVEKLHKPSRGVRSAEFEGFHDQTWFIELWS